MIPIYVSYYTVGGGYEEEAAGLLQSLDAFKLPYRAIGVNLQAPSAQRAAQAWRGAAQYKAEILRDMLKAMPGRALVWLDADARVVAEPELFASLNCDLAGHWYRGRELLSGTLYFGPSAAARQLVEDWIQSNRAQPGSWDQRNLQRIVAASTKLHVERLPPEYAWIDAGGGKDLSFRAYGSRRPVIVQRQASRRLKKHCL
jgi:hypothetical protein